MKVNRNFFEKIPLALYLGLAVGYLALWLLAFIRQEAWRADFTNYYTGATLIREGNGAALYDFHLQTQRQQEILGGRYLADGLLPFNHPPHLALLLVPLSALPLTQANLVWGLLNIALWAGFLVDVGRYISRQEKGINPLILSAVAALPAMFHALVLGASVILSTVALWGFYRALKDGKETIAGVWFILGSLHPQIWLFPFLLLLGARRWRTLTVVAVGGLTIFTLSGLLLGWSVWPGFVEMLHWTASSFKSGGVIPVGMVNLKSLLTIGLGGERGDLINGLTIAGLLAAAGGALLLWRGKWQPERPDFELRVGLTFLMGLFFAPHANAQDSLLVALVGLLMWTFLKHREKPTRVLEGIPILLYPLWLVDIFFWDPNPVPTAVIIALGIALFLSLRGEGEK